VELWPSRQRCPALKALRVSWQWLDPPSTRSADNPSWWQVGGQLAATVTTFHGVALDKLGTGWTLALLSFSNGALVEGTLVLPHDERQDQPERAEEETDGEPSGDVPPFVPRDYRRYNTEKEPDEEEFHGCPLKGAPDHAGEAAWQPRHVRCSCSHGARVAPRASLSSAWSAYSRARPPWAS
jgi:hypothetical protein